jgi:hypothetical protein
VTIFLAWVGGITILALAVVGVTYLGVVLSAKADLTDMGPESWDGRHKLTDEEDGRQW